MSEADGVRADDSTWAVHFPGNLRWSNAMQIVKGMAPYAAVAMDEVDRVGRRLKARAALATEARRQRGNSKVEADPDKVWREEWAAMADRVAAVADQAAAEGREITAGNTTCARTTTTTARSASSRRAWKSSRCIARRCAPIRRRWSGCIRR